MIVLSLLVTDYVIGGLLACLPTVATEGWPGSKGLFDTICTMHQGPWEGVVPSTITLYVYDINYTMLVGGRPSQGIPIEPGFWIGTLPRSLNHRFVPPSNHWLTMPEKKCPKIENVSCFYWFSTFEKIISVCYLSLEVLSFDII